MYQCYLCTILYFGTPSRLFSRLLKNPIHNKRVSFDRAGNNTGTSSCIFGYSAYLRPKANGMRRPQIVEQIRKALSRVAPDAQAILYGSEARGDARPDSDIDLLVLVDSNQLTVQEEERIIAPLYDIEIETGVQINARVLLKKLWEHRPIRTPFQINVMNEGIVL